GKGRAAQGTKAIDAPKQTNIVREPYHRPTGRKKRTPKVVIQEPPSVLVKKTQESFVKLKGIELLSDVAQLQIKTQRAIKASRHESRFQHQTSGSSEGVGLRREVPDELIGKYADSDEGVGTSPKVPNESEDKSKPRDDLDDWGSTNEEEYLLAYKDEKPEDILWQSTDDEESENDDEEDEYDEDKSINIEKTDDERTNTHDEDIVMGKVEKTVEQKEDEEHRADEEQKGDEHAGDEQVVVPVSTTQKEWPSLLQSPSSHSVSSNFRNQFINSLNASLIGTIPKNVEAEINSLLDIQIQQDVPNIQQELFHAVKVSVIPETTQIPPTTAPVPPLPATKIPSTQVSNSEAVKSVQMHFRKYFSHTLKNLKRNYLRRGTTRMLLKSTFKLTLLTKSRIFCQSFYHRQ
ncbi:hypothetical protein Tco_1528801, partial [Tanacetum coccineum]